MDEIVANAIQKAADLIREGELNSAKPLLTEILKRNDQIEQAWFLLSYTLPDTEKSIYALEQAIKINPEFDKASERLEKLKARPKKSAIIQEELPEESITKKWDVTSKTEDLPNLENLFEPEVGQNDQSEITSPFYDSTFIDGDDISDENEDPKKGFARFRKPLLLGLVLVAVLLTLLYFGQQLIPNMGSAGTSLPKASSTLSQGFRTLPPTWTPSP